MNIQEFNKNMGNVVRDMQGTPNAEIMVRIGVSARTAIYNRIIATGVNAEGQKFKPYSTKPMLVGMGSFFKKTAGDKFLGNKKTDWRTVGGSSGYAAYLSASAGNKTGDKGVHLAILPGGYKQLRELQGRQTAFVDFSLTQAMWKDISVISKPTDHQKGTVIIGAKDDTEKKKLEGNTKRRGDILDLSSKEIDQLKQEYNLGVLQIFKTNGL